MRVAALGEAATHLPWLAPCAASLVRLARAVEPGTWAAVRADPGCVLLIACQTQPTPASCWSSLLHDPGICARAGSLLGTSDSTFVNWSVQALRPIWEASQRYAGLAERLALRSGSCPPDHAWAAGLIAPLGWLAAAAVDPEAAAACLADPDLAEDAAGVQQRHWGLHQGEIARRLARRWQLPAWLAATAGHLDLDAATASGLGADPSVFLTVQTAVALAQETGGLHLPIPGQLDDLAAELGLTAADLDEARNAAGSDDPLADWLPPASQPLLGDLLSIAADNRRLSEAPTLQRLEADVDALHRALGRQQHSEADRLQARKLAALAEFAAGAGHEINNPLAVISGQAQYLLKKLADYGVRTADLAEEAAIRTLQAAVETSLQTIVGQARRIHDILTELMQFARPASPQRQVVDLSLLVRETVAALGELAARQQVELRWLEPSQPFTLLADPRQARTALTCLVRNALEAAPPGGWAAVRTEHAGPATVDLVVEDSGPGPTPAQREHMFDPFYSGRQAGRGRGLGLPTAWRLARENGGDLLFVPQPGGPTRFVLRLPRELTNGHAHLTEIRNGDSEHAA